MDISIFTDKAAVPGNEHLKGVLAANYQIWDTLREYVKLKYPKAIEEWNYPGAKYGWSFRIKDSKRAILYLLPRNGYFKVAFVFGQKATDTILGSSVHPQIKAELASAKVYAEGRGIHIDINDFSLVNDIKMLIDIKLAN